MFFYDFFSWHSFALFSMIFLSLRRSFALRRLPVWIDFSKKLKPSQVVSVFPNSVEVEIESVEVETERQLTENSVEVKTERISALSYITD